MDLLESKTLDENVCQSFEDNLFGHSQFRDSSIEEILGDHDLRHISPEELAARRFKVSDPHTQDVLTAITSRISEVLFDSVDFNMNPNSTSKTRGDAALKAFKQYAQEKGSRLHENTDRSSNNHLNDLEFCAESIGLIRLATEFYVLGNHAQAELDAEHDERMLALQQAGLLQCDLNSRQL